LASIREQRTALEAKLKEAQEAAAAAAKDEEAARTEVGRFDSMAVCCASA